MPCIPVLNDRTLRTLSCNTLGYPIDPMRILDPNHAWHQEEGVVWVHKPTY